MKITFLMLLVLSLFLFPCGLCKSLAARPSVVNIGSILRFNSTIGGVSAVAIRAALEDINSDPTILNGTALQVDMRDTNCDDGFLAMVQALQFMETDVIAIIGPQCSTIAHIISFVANELRVPLMAFASDPTLSSIQLPFFVRTAPSDLYQMAAVAAVVDYYQWKIVTAIYVDDDYGRNGIAALDDELTARRCKISYKVGFPGNAKRSELLNLLVTVNNMESRVIIVHTSAPSGLQLFSLANRLNMMGNGYVWIATDWLSSYLDANSTVPAETISGMQGVLTLRPHIPKSKMKSNLISKWSSLSKKYNHSDLRTSAYAFYVYDSVWTVARALDSFFDDGGSISFSNDSKLRDQTGGTLHLEAMSIFDMGNKLLGKIRKVNFTGVSGQVQFDTQGDLIHPAYDIINIIGNGVRTIGFWSNYTRLLSTVLPEDLYSKPPNSSLANQHLYDVIWPGETAKKPRGWAFPSNAKELKIGVPNRFSFKEFVTIDNVTGSMKGYCVDVFTQALALLPYPVTYKFVPFGSGTENPHYDELVQMVENNVFDGAIGDIAITMNRTQTVDFTQPFIETGLVILAPVKKHITNSWAFLQPFTLEMWCVTGLFFLIVGVVVWVLEHRVNDDFRGPPREQIMTIFWFSFSTLFFAHRENTMSTLGRGVLIIWLFVVLIIVSSYTASLTSILTVQQLDTSIRGLDDLKSSDYPIGFQVGSFAEEYMVKELNISRLRLKALGSPEEYAENLKLGPKKGGVMAIVDERPYVELFLSTYCKIAVAGSDFTSRGWGFAFPRDSPLQIDLSTAILALSENGELQRIHDKWLKTGECTADNTEFVDSNQLRLASFWGLFLICGVACVLALLIYFSIMLRRYLKHESPEAALSLESGSSKSKRSIKKFISFVDDKELPRKKRSLSLSRSSMPTTPTGSLSVLDIERPVRSVRNVSVTEIRN
ncbi:glutamate receptor 3.1-like isoform X1 [Phragmites australis]|uniref:glutamate receptor 3.1-like isoform X1 n=1 Tax=Phragmites australis TaxID=29695 RepID=UPI002D77EC8A|nr:glutamate receptor 3.1-like isoform X1 [Phragmites australis]XP_062217968.1 glutamate receptor 3.1-like isoform X1 [Phragmites australis]